MMERKTPGVYVTETSLNPAPIEGVGTSTAAFVGPTAQGQAGVSAVTSYSEFAAAYGTAATLQFAPVTKGGAPIVVPNYMALAVQAFFENGGQQLYVSRVATTSVPAAADYQAALAALANVGDVSVVAAPGSSVFGGVGGAAPTPAQAAAILAELIAHVNQVQYRFAVLDTPPNYSVSDVETLRGLIACDSAALYFPWVTVVDPLAKGTQINIPPSGFVCGIYAQSDSQHGVWKAPANIALAGAVGLEQNITDLQQGPLNSAGVNCLRTFPGRGILVWGARTVSSNPQWIYVSVRRFTMYLEQSIEQGLQWVVFEPNGPALWAQIANAVEAFLLVQWRAGALQGISPQQAFFVRCDRTTMTQTDIDNGRVICEVGIAPVQPAEFVVIRIEWIVNAT